jgi:hypothetical protein
MLSGMAAVVPETRDDRVLTYTRTLSVAIVPFLLLGFVLLYLFPGDTASLFAWTVKPRMTPMVMGSAYLGGTFFFVQASREERWTVL